MKETTKNARYPYLHVEVPLEEVDEQSALLWELGALGLEERDATTLDKPLRARGSNSLASKGATLIASFDTEKNARAARRKISKEFPSRIVFVEGDEWRDKWKAHFKVTRLGKRLVIRPSWEKYRKKRGEVVLTLDPGQAFGTGTHESTRLLLKELDRRTKRGMHVLDVGCGSGILSIAALLLGAQDARSIDVDPDAIAVTSENAQINGVDDRIAASTLPIENVRGTFQLVLANIEARVLIPSAREIRKRVAPGGLLFLSGLLIGQEKEVRTAYRSMELIASPVDGEWIALVLKKP